MLLVYRRGHRPYLHSFPTRRSSDLSELDPLRSSWEDIWGDPKTDKPDAKKPLETEKKTEVTPDRKSTRLNSSHSQISYAVFCLKKKRESGAVVPPKQTSRPSGAGMI